MIYRMSFSGCAIVLALGLISGVQGAEEKAKKGEWTGELGCAKCNFSDVTKSKTCGSTLKVGETCYLIKASDKGGTELTKKVSVGCNTPTKGFWKLAGVIHKDKDGKSWIIADSATLVKGDKKEPEKKK